MRLGHSLHFRELHAAVAEQEAVIDTIVREAAAYYRSIMVRGRRHGRHVAPIVALRRTCALSSGWIWQRLRWHRAAGHLLPLHCRHRRRGTHRPRSVLVAPHKQCLTTARHVLYRGVGPRACAGTARECYALTRLKRAAAQVCIVAHSAHTFQALSSVRELGTVAQAPWGSIVLGKPPAQYTAIPPMLQAAIPAHAEWVALLGVGYLPCTVYWAAVLVAHELWVVHVWWLACGVPAIVAAYVMGVQCGDSMLRDAAGLAAYKYSLKTA